MRRPSLSFYCTPAAALVVIATLGILCAPNAKAPVEVDLKLVLAVDLSYSMDLSEQLVERAGYVQAFRQPEVIEAILSGRLGRVAITYIEWAGAASPVVRVPWTVIDSAASAARLAANLQAVPLQKHGSTSISGALLFAASSLDDHKFAAQRRVIDISGDGPNNEGLPVTVARDTVVTKGIVINGLPVLINPDSFNGVLNNHNIEWYYENCVIGGIGAFVIPVTDISDFGYAIRRKLWLEISEAPTRPMLVAETVNVSPVECLTEVEAWRRWYDGADQ